MIWETLLWALSLIFIMFTAGIGAIILFGVYRELKKRK